MSQDPQSKPDPIPFGGFTPEELAELRKYVRMRMDGVPFFRIGGPRNLTSTVSSYDAEGNFVSERPATDEEVERWREERRRLGWE